MNSQLLYPFCNACRGVFKNTCNENVSKNNFCKAIVNDYFLRLPTVIYKRITGGKRKIRKL